MQNSNSITIDNKNVGVFYTLTRKDLNHYTIALGPIVKTAEQHHYGD